MLAIQASFDQEFMGLLNEAKNIVGPIPMAEVLRRSLKEFVNKRNKAPRESSKTNTAPMETQAKEISSTSEATKKPTRYIPRHTRYKIQERDQHQCTFVSSEGHRCSETRGLQVDHIIPFARGGANETSNLRLLCPAHNRLYAERIFGKQKIESYFQRGGDL